MPRKRTGLASSREDTVTGHITRATASNDLSEQTKLRNIPRPLNILRFPTKMTADSNHRDRATHRRGQADRSLAGLSLPIHQETAPGHPNRHARQRHLDRPRKGFPLVLGAAANSSTGLVIHSRQFIKKANNSPTAYGRLTPPISHKRCKLFANCAVTYDGY